jgi:hypothetical protein
MKQTQTQTRKRAVRGTPASDRSFHPYSQSSLRRADRLIARIEELTQERTSTK